MRKWLRDSDHRVQRIYENMEIWAREEMALLCEEWCAYKITNFDIAPYSFAFTAKCWQNGNLSYATCGYKRLVIRPRLLKIAETASYEI